MLEIEMEPYKGILFIRLSGSLDRKNISKVNNTIIKFIKNLGIKNIVFNLNEINKVDKYGQNALIKSLNICQSNNGKAIICIDNKKIKNELSNKLKKITVLNEISAVNIINS